MTTKNLMNSIFLFGISLLISTQILAQQSTTGPTPPQGVSLGEDYGGWRAEDVVITGVPRYSWYRGCAPTAMGMVIGYYDTHGFDDLIAGDASTQTSVVNDAIASSQHYSDYSLPKDYYPSLVADNSETGNTHGNNCIADFMQTSRSNVGNYWGWTWLSEISSGFEGYFSTKYDNYETFTSQIWYSDTDGWEAYKQEVDNNTPVLILVDTDGDNSTDHFVTGVGYNEDERQYGIYDTWSNEIRWHLWQGKALGNEWGVFSVSTFEIYSDIVTGINPVGCATVTGAGFYRKGETVELIATPEEGYDFTYWMEEGVILSTNAHYSFLAAGNRYIVANFEQTVDVKPGEEVDDVRIFPNPATHTLLVRQKRIQQLAIVDISGKIITSIDGNNNDEITIDIGDYPQGIYFVRVTGEQMTTVTKVVFE